MHAAVCIQRASSSTAPSSSDAKDANGDEDDQQGGLLVAGRYLRCISRTINSKHPLAITFPGLSNRVDATKLQCLAAIGLSVSDLSART